MANLIVTPIDYSKPGSHRQRDHLLECFEALEEAQESHRAKPIRMAFRRMEEVVKAFLRTDDDSPVEQALDEISGDEFVALFQALIGGNSVGEVIAPS